MLSVERHEKILEILKTKKTATISYLCEKFFVSSATIRRDLTYLEKLNQVKRIHGGVAIVQGGSIEPSYFLRESENTEAKRRICAAAVDFVRDGHTIFIDSSSTLLCITDQLDSKHNLTIVTNGLKNAIGLFENCNAKVFVAGGFIKEGSTATVGGLANDFINKFKTEIALVSCVGISSEGIFEATEEHWIVKESILKNAGQVILLCDSSKFNKTYLFKLCDFNSISAIITEKEPPEELRKAIEDSGCEVIVV